MPFEPGPIRARSTRPSRRALWALLALLAAAIAPLGCDDYGDIRAGLDEAEVARFDRGMRAAVPCWSCHDVTGTAIKVGPPLSGIVGRPAASAHPYGYSNALRASGIVWTPATLDRFLADPARFVPGTRMVSPGIADPALRGDLVFFLVHATPVREAR
jgi:cytochrome c